MANIRLALFRPTAKPAVAMPIGARSVGHDRVGPSFRDSPAVKHFVQFFWGIKGTGTLVIEGKSRSLPPDHIALYMPGDYHDIRADGQPWEYRWWTFDGALASASTRAFGFASAGVWPAARAPDALFDRLERAMRDVSPRGERRSSALAYELVAAAATAARPGSAVSGAGTLSLERGPASRILQIIHQQWRRADFGVEQLASELGEHRSRLSRQFKVATGISPSGYLQNLRVQNALSLLKETTLPVVEIAARCGWSDAAYFSRCIRECTSMSPREFRKA